MTENKEPKVRKVVQIAATSLPERQEDHPVLIALCDDGAMFKNTLDYSTGWIRIQAIPQPVAKE